MEKELKREIRNTKVQRAILSTIQLAGLLSVVLLAPNVLKVLGKKRSTWSDRNVRSALSRLIEKGLVHAGPDGIALTAKGTRFLNISTPKVKRPSKWDHKWRVVIFDIPESRKGLRRMLRQQLIEIGFYRLQNSVWIYPFDCEELIALLKADFRVGTDILYMIVDKLEGDTSLRRHFDLK